ncbi:hypothetical protein ACMAVT_20545 [Streptomyces sp. FW42]|uniref:hypothetical protein n=1 Tax=Streptomyces sp. FW42 TaxID=3395371 RepID=UPI003A83D70C
MTADRWTRMVRQQVGLGRLLPLGGPYDGAWIAERAAGGVLRDAAGREVPEARLDSVRIGLADPGTAVEPAVPAPPSALPPGPLRLTAEFAATAAWPLPATASRLRTSLAVAATERLGLDVTEVDLRVTELLDEEPSAAPSGAPETPGAAPTPGNPGTPGNAVSPGAAAPATGTGMPGAADTSTDARTTTTGTHGVATTPGATGTPKDTGTPGATGTPGDAGTPEAADVPAGTQTPGAAQTPPIAAGGAEGGSGCAEAPSNATTPRPTGTPKDAGTPRPTGTPKDAGTPRPTGTPKDASTPEAADVPAGTQTPGAAQTPPIAAGGAAGGSGCAEAPDAAQDVGGAADAFPGVDAAGGDGSEAGRVAAAVSRVAGVARLTGAWGRPVRLTEQASGAGTALPRRHARVDLAVAAGFRPLEVARAARAAAAEALPDRPTVAVLVTDLD